MHYYTHNIGEFAAKTRFLTPEEVGVYVILKDEYFANGMRLACDRIANLMPPACEESLSHVLQRFFIEEDGFYRCPEFDEELSGYSERGKTNRENAKKRWTRRKSECESDANGCESDANRTDPHAKRCLTNNQEPITNNKEERVVERKPRAPLTHAFSAETLPAAWRDYCTQVRPDLDAENVFAAFSFYYREGSGSATLRSDKGWGQAWQNWVRREKAPTQKPAAKSGDGVAHFDENGRLTNYMTMDFRKQDWYEGINPDGTFKR